MTDALDVKLIDDSQDTWVIGMSGEWDMYTGGLMVTELFEQSALQRRHVVLDIGGLTFVDSTALSRILDLAKATAANGRQLILLRPSPPVEALLAVTGLKDHLRTVKSLEQAWAFIGEPPPRLDSDLSDPRPR